MATGVTRRETWHDRPAERRGPQPGPSPSAITHKLSMTFVGSVLLSFTTKTPFNENLSSNTRIRGHSSHGDDTGVFRVLVM